MSKVQMGPHSWLYPAPTVLVGADVDGKPNFMAVAWCGIANGTPPMISLAIRPKPYTSGGIKQNREFSVNVPSVDIVRETDYCGIVSGTEVNKAEVCRFNVFYGKLEHAPMIEQCPINMECAVVHTLNLGSHELFIGQIIETHISEECLTDGKPDTAKISPFLFTTGSGEYHAFGEVIGKGFSIGRELKRGE